MTSRGFTLVETLVVVGLTSLIMGVLGSLLVFFYKSNAYVFQHASATLEARRGITETVRYVREASYPVDGSDPIQTAEASTLTLSADTDNDGELDEVTYTYQNGTLSRTITLAGEAAATNATLSTSVRNDASTPVFRYYDSIGAELAQPVDESLVSAIKMTLVIQIDTNRGPAAFTLTGDATLRNTRL